MRLLGEVRGWPPDHADELSLLLSVASHHAQSRMSRGDDPDYGILTALDELADWLSRARGDTPSSADRKALVHDIRGAVGARGPSLTGLSGTGAELIAAVAGLIGDERDAVGHLTALTDRLRSELSTPAAMVAAFDDLAYSVAASDTTTNEVEARLHMLSSALRFNDHQVSRGFATLAEILDDAAVTIDRVRGQERPVSEDVSDIWQLAGTSIDERIRLCHTYLLTRTPTAEHVVWLVYGHARLSSPDWRIRVGPIEFLDGPTMVEALRNPASARIDVPLPVELTKAEIDGGISSSRSWPKPEFLDRWVAARVELGTGQFSDAVRVAREQADAVVHLATFEHGKSSWRPTSGYIHMMNGRKRASAGPFHDPPATRYAAHHDTTDEAIADLTASVPFQLPLENSVLRTLIAAAKNVTFSSRSDEPADITQDVRVLEIVARLCEVPDWTGFAVRYNAVTWAYNQVLDTIYGAVQGVVDDLVLLNAGLLEAREEYNRQLVRHESWRRITVDLGAALELIPVLSVAVPVHHAASRRLRTVAARTASVESLARWVDELVLSYRAKIARAARYRNGLTHGGVADEQVARTVRHFTNDQARTAVAAALRASMEGQLVKSAYSDRRKAGKVWRAKIDGSVTVHDALFDAVNPSNRVPET